MTFPVDRVEYRSFPPQWSGEVFVCDIDRTYLATRFSSMKGLARIPFESAVDKKAIAGMATLLKEIRRGPQGRSRHTPLYFISASPAKLRPVIERKMLLDGLEYDGTTFKDWVGVTRSLRWGRFRDQVGYKITALLQARSELPAGAEYVLIGDDVESDALAYSLYADILSGRLSKSRIPVVLKRHGVARDDARAIADLGAQLRHASAVERIYIRLEQHEALELIAFAPHVVAARGAFQMSVSLFDAGSIALEGVVRVSRDLAQRGMSREELAEVLVDAIRRGLTKGVTTDRVKGALVEAGLLGEDPLPRDLDPQWAAAHARDAGECWTPAAYL